MKLTKIILASALTLTGLSGCVNSPERNDGQEGLNIYKGLEFTPCEQEGLDIFKGVDFESYEEKTLDLFKNLREPKSYTSPGGHPAEVAGDAGAAGNFSDFKEIDKNLRYKGSSCGNCFFRKYFEKQNKIEANSSNSRLNK